MSTFLDSCTHCAQGGAGKSARTRAAILAAALVAFEADGYQATTVDAIAKRAGVVRQTVVNHFPRKEDFVLAWGLRRRQHTEHIALTGSATERLHTLYAGLAELNVAERDLTRALHPHYLSIALPRHVPEALLAIVDAARRDHEITGAVSTIEIGELLTGVYFDTVTRWVLSPDRDLAADLRTRIDLLLSGLGSR